MKFHLKKFPFYRRTKPAGQQPFILFVLFALSSDLLFVTKLICTYDFWMVINNRITHWHKQELELMTAMNNFNQIEWYQSMDFIASFCRLFLSATVRATPMSRMSLNRINRIWYCPRDEKFSFFKYLCRLFLWFFIIRILSSVCL